MSRCPSDIQAFNLNFWNQSDTRDEMLLRYDGNTVRAVFTPTYKPTDDRHIVRELAKAGVKDESPVIFHGDKNFMSLSILNSDHHFVKEDEFQTGTKWINSEVGCSSLAWFDFIMKLVCSNGMVRTYDNIQGRYRHVSDKLKDRISEWQSQAMFNFADSQTRFLAADTIEVEDVEEKFEALNKQFELSPTQRQAVQWAMPYELRTEGRNSLYNVIDVYTRAAQYQLLDSQSSHELEVYGGKILQTVSLSINA
jgi:hypothetical protein